MEIGTLGGCSTIWFARAIPSSGKVVTIEASAAHAEVARANLDRADVADRVELRSGRALDFDPNRASHGLLGVAAAFIQAVTASQLSCSTGRR